MGGTGQVSQKLERQLWGNLTVRAVQLIVGGTYAAPEVVTAAQMGLTEIHGVFGNALTSANDALIVRFVLAADRRSLDIRFFEAAAAGEDFTEKPAEGIATLVDFLAVGD
jgi:hypothetical protein